MGVGGDPDPALDPELGACLKDVPAVLDVDVLGRIGKIRLLGVVIGAQTGADTSNAPRTRVHEIRLASMNANTVVSATVQFKARG